MWAIAETLKDKAKDIDAWVNQGQNKPTLNVKGIEKYQSITNYVQSIEKYGYRILPKDLSEARAAAKKICPGSLEKTFLVLKD
jgi:peptidyl-tRNA hydrolase